MYNKKFYNLIENFNSILYKKRMFYPRNFSLSPEFTAALKKEIKRLKAENLKSNQIIDKLSKCLHFLIKEP
jgi:hypothetical protein